MVYAFCNRSQANGGFFGKEGTPVWETYADAVWFLKRCNVRVRAAFCIIELDIDWAETRPPHGTWWQNRMAVENRTHGLKAPARFLGIAKALNDV